MKKITYIFLSLSIGLFGLGSTYASTYEKNLTYEQFLNLYLTKITQNQKTPESYKYIQVKYTNIPKGSYLYKLTQKAIYLNVFPNAKIKLPLKSPITQRQSYLLIKKSLNIETSYQDKQHIDIETFKKIINEIDYILDTQKKQIPKSENNDEVMDTEIIDSVYQRLKSDYLYPERISGDNNIQYETIKGIINNLGDQNTIFYPPGEAKTLNEELEGKYEGIGAYIQKDKNGKIIIYSTIKGGPAEKGGILAGDQIIKIENEQINSGYDIKKITSLIKGPKNSTVKITILRGDKEISFTLKRQNIELKNIESKVLSGEVCYIDINLFDFGISKDYYQIMGRLNLETDCNKYIFDVRDNPGGGLEEVSNILGDMIPKGENIVNIKGKDREENYRSTNPRPNNTGKNMIVLINGASASASEIFAGVMKEYIPHTVLIGEKTFGKGTVQSMIQYIDGSILKYTIAKRYTGKNKKNIDGIGFQPDFQIQDNKSTPMDDQLEFALDYNFSIID